MTSFRRLSRVGVPDLLPEGHKFEVGKANLLREGQRFVRPSREDAGRHGRCGKTLVRRLGETRAGLGYDVPILFPRQDVITSGVMSSHLSGRPS